MPSNIAIIGGGPAGMALALALFRAGRCAEIFDARDRAASEADPRVLALSHGSMQTLNALGVGPDLPHTVIERIHVSHQGGLGRTQISAAEEKVPALGYVVRAGDLARALNRALDATSVTRHAACRIDPAAPPAAALTVWAEGAVSASGDIAVRDYQQSAVIAEVTPASAHHHTAWERFTAHGPVAALPCGAGLAIVYTCATADAAAVATLPDADFLARLHGEFGGRLAFTTTGPRHVFPLQLRYRRQITAERAVWIGNAAQTLHPVGGQGFNLALRDIHALAALLTDAPDPGAADVLARYAQARRADRRATIELTHGLVRLFGSGHFLLRHARGAGLMALDLLPPLRSLFARQMMFGVRG